MNFFYFSEEDEEDKKTIREIVEKLIPKFPKEQREKAKQVLYRLVAETKVMSYCQEGYIQTSLQLIALAISAPITFIHFYHLHSYSSIFISFHNSHPHSFTTFINFHTRADFDW